MKNKLSMALLLMLTVMILSQTSIAQVYSDYDTVRVVKASYVPITPGSSGTTKILSSEFFLPPNVLVSNSDDGYKTVNLPFPFEFNGDVYNTVNICVNGFVTFAAPQTLSQFRSTGLFIDDINTYATNVIAPFWGDHKYRNAAEAAAPNTYKESAIYTNTANTSTTFSKNGVATTQKVFTIEWRDLNVNKNISDLQSSIANFQLKIYQSTDEFTNQSDFEFCYGTVGGNLSTTLTTVHTKSASVGIKGEFGDFVNALYNDKTTGPSNPYALSKTSNSLTNEWTPSGFNDQRLRFNALRRFSIDEFWGDGDADFSKAEGRPHYNYRNNQGRYVTVNDVRTILRSVAKKYPLDSIRKRAAYHADVDHNGRFYYATSGSITTRTDIKNRDLNYADNLPAGITSIKKVFYQANEFDASKILNFLAGKIPSLPWRYDTIPQYGKQNPVSGLANGIKIGQVDSRNGNLFVPIYLNGISKGAVSAKFEVNGTVVNVTKNTDDMFITEFDNSSVVIAASGNFNENEPFAFVEYTPNSNGVTLNDIVFNENKVGSITTIEDLNTAKTDFTSNPNPLVSETKISFNVTEAGKYTLAVYDMIGNVVAELANNNFSVGNYDFNWDASNVQSGLYVCKLTSNKSTLINKLVVKK